MTALPVVIGIGSNNGDDAAGWIAIERLHELGMSSEVVRIARHPAELLDWWEVGRELIVCDACEGVGDPGELRHFTWPTEKLPASPPRSSHEMSLTYVLELGRTLRRIPASVSVWTIAGTNWLPNTPVSPTVQTAARVVGDEIQASIYGSPPPAQH